MAGSSVLTLFTRTGCGLCEEMLSEVIAHTRLSLADIELVDIDLRPELKALYGNRIPVLEKAGVELAAGRISPEALSQLQAEL